MLKHKGSPLAVFLQYSQNHKTSTLVLSGCFGWMINIKVEKSGTEAANAFKIY